MSCTAEQIAEKKRLALERLKQTKASQQSATSSKNARSPGAATFYGNEKNEKANQLNQYENKMKHQPSHSSSNRILSQPYPQRNANPNLTPTNANNHQKNQNTASIFKKVVTCTCSMISQTRFQVTESGYFATLIDVYKSIPTRAFGKYRKLFH